MSRGAADLERYEKVAWKVPVPGLGWSSPVVTDGKIYLSTSVDIAAEGDKPEVHELRACATTPGRARSCGTWSCSTAKGP